MKNKNFIFLNRRAQAEFTDRENPRESFDGHLSQAIMSAKSGVSNIRVLQYYGIAGIGKTRLAKEFRKSLVVKYPTIPISTLDFDDPSTRSLSRGLLRMRTSIEPTNTIKFTLFDLAYAIFFKKRNPDYAFEKKSLPFLDEASVLGNIIGAIDGLGVVSAATGVVELTKKYTEKLAISPEAKSALSALSDMTEKEISEVLPQFFAYDVNAYTKKTRNPFITFIDTYEALWSDEVHESEAFSKDTWVRDLVEALENGLTVITGREKLRWSEVNADFDKIVDAHLLGRLGERDTEKFLRSAGVKDASLIQSIIDVSGGHPYYLDLCLDTIAQEGGKSIEKWPEAERDLFDRFAKSLTAQELALLKRLAVVDAYDIEYVREAARHFNIGLNDDQIEAHSRFSFVKPLGELRALHSIMKRSLVAHTEKAVLSKIHDFAFTHFKKRLQGITKRDNVECIILPFRECANQLYHLGDETRAHDWLKEEGQYAIQVLQDRAAVGPVLDALDTLSKFLSVNNWPSGIQIAYADVTHLTGEYKKSVELLSAFLEQNQEDSITPGERMFARVRRLHHSMMFVSLDEVWRDTESLLQEMSREAHPLAFGEALFLIGGNLGATRGLPEKASPWLRRALGHAVKSSDVKLRVRIYRKASDLMRIERKLDASRCLLERALNIAEGHTLIRYQNYLQCTLVDQLRLEGKYQEALNLLVQVRPRLASENLDGWLGHTFLLEGTVLAEIGKAEQASLALSKAKAAYDRTSHLWGKLACEGLRLRIASWIGKPIEDVVWEQACSEMKDAGYIRDALELESDARRIRSQAPAITLL